ncbi:hypothetical protein I204_07087 [Kwoniella mangroviensis CBS 8886]|nr:hypothetical protein I204_07087 [Kwoniella mangroviensis CBS 8886]
MENEHYQIEERVDYLVVDSQNEKRAAGTGTLVFVDHPISKLFKKNLRKLAKYNGFSVAYSQKSWQADKRAVSGYERKYDLGIHVTMNPKQDAVAANGMMVKRITPAEFCDYIEDLRQNSPESKVPINRRKPKRTKKKGKKRGKKTRSKSAKKWKAGATKQKNGVKQE